MAVDPTSFICGTTYYGNGLSDLPTTTRQAIVFTRGQSQPMPAKTCTYCKSSGQGINCVNCGAALPKPSVRIDTPPEPFDTRWDAGPGDPY